MKIKFKNNDKCTESHVSDLSDLRSLNLEGGYIAFLIPYTNSAEAVKNINDYVLNQNIQLKATDTTVELVCSYADIAELERALMDYQTALELYIDDLELDRQIDRRLRLKILWLYLHVNSRIINLLIEE